MKNEIKEFDKKQIRVAWDENKEEWLFSIIDVIFVLVDSKDFQSARNYWKVLKKRLKDEGNETVTNCNQLKMKAADGKLRVTDVASMEQLFRLIQSIPSKKAEPFKLWLAKVGKDRVEETIDPELTIDRALNTYQKKGYSNDWIHQRLMAIRVRNELTDEWKNKGVKENQDYAILTDEIIKTWSGMSTKGYKKLKKENLRDNMTTTELILTMLAEAATKDISETNESQNMSEHIEIAHRGGKVAKKAREELEKETGKPVITSNNAKDIQKLLSDIIVDVSNIEKNN
ncbi:MAG: Bro-N domain-containing protein [Lachnospiraceae bacterium]|nr:Bro-N domain-containing protein [Lachnospiraceae bacterium]